MITLRNVRVTSKEVALIVQGLAMKRLWLCKEIYHSQEETPEASDAIDVIDQLVAYLTYQEPRKES